MSGNERCYSGTYYPTLSFPDPACGELIIGTCAGAGYEAGCPVALVPELFKASRLLSFNFRKRLLMLFVPKASSIQRAASKKADRINEQGFGRSAS